jgi:hypothetical protein
MGTPDYMAPEQALGLPADARADFYALGISAFHMLTGRVPFQGASFVEVLQQQTKSPCPDPRTLRPEIPAPLAALVLRLTQKRAEDRPQSHAEIAAALAPLAGEGGAEVASGPPSALRFVGGALGGKRVVLPLGESFVGRQADCLIVLDDAQVSRRHAALVRGEAGLKVRDLASRNGVLVNGARVAQAELAVGDRLRIGDVTFQVEAASDAPPVLEVTDPHVAMPAAALAPMARANLLRELAFDLCSGGRLRLERLGEITHRALFPLRRIALVGLVDGKAQTLFHAARGEGDKVPPVQAAMQLCLASAKVVTALDARKDPRFTAGAAPEVATVLAAPLLGPAGPFGVLYGDARETQVLSPEELVAFETLAHLLAASLGRAG